MRDDLPVGYVEDVLDARAFMRAKQIVAQCDAASKDAPDSPLVQRVIDVQGQLATEARTRG